MQFVWEVHCSRKLSLIMSLAVFIDYDKKSLYSFDAGLKDDMTIENEA